MDKLTYKSILNVFLCHCRESGVVDDDRVSWDFEYGDKVRHYFLFIAGLRQVSQMLVEFRNFETDMSREMEVNHSIFLIC